MADTGLIARNYDLGFKSDIARDQLPRGAAFRMRDYIPQNGAPLQGRGGWSNATKDLSAASSASRMTGVAWAPFANDPHLIVVSESGKVYNCKTFDGASGSFIDSSGLTAGITHPPIWHNDRLILLQALGQTPTEPRKYFASGVTYDTDLVSGSPPLARVGWSFGEYLALANGSVSGVDYPYRVWYSGVGNSDSWATGSAFFDSPEEVVAGVFLRNIQLIWSYRNTYMVTGDTPPPGDNFELNDLFQGNGCMDARSVARWREYAIWANQAGVWRSDGATLTNLAEKGDIFRFWRDAVRDFKVTSGWSAAGFVHAGHYGITIINASGVVVATLLCDLDRLVWTEFENVPAAMYATRAAGPGTSTATGHEETFFASRIAPRAGSLSSCWSPSTAVANDGDGTPVLPELETEFIKMGNPGLKRIIRAMVTYDVRSAGASPYLEVSHITSPEDTTYDLCSPTSRLPTTTKIERRHVDIRRKCLGAALKIAQVGASASTSLHDIELQGHVLEASR